MKTDDPSIYVWMGGRTAMLTTRQKLHLIAIEEEIAHLQLQMCMEECAYLGAAKDDTAKEANATAYIEKVIRPVLEKIDIKFETKDYDYLKTIINHPPKVQPKAVQPKATSTKKESALARMAKATASSAAKAVQKVGKTMSNMTKKTTKAQAYNAIETKDIKGNFVMVLIGFATGSDELVIHITTKDILRTIKEKTIEWSTIWAEIPATFENDQQEFTTQFAGYMDSLSEKELISTDELANQQQLAQINRDTEKAEKKIQAAEALQNAKIAAEQKLAAAEQAAASRRAATEAAAAKKAAEEAEKKAAAHPHATAAGTTHAAATSHPATPHVPASATHAAAVVRNVLSHK
jgi:hypothetical protein